MYNFERKISNGDCNRLLGCFIVLLLQCFNAAWAPVSMLPIGSQRGTPWKATIVKRIGLNYFDLVPILTVQPVATIRINGVSHGGQGDKDKGSIELDNDEYIAKIEYRHYNDQFCPTPNSCVERDDFLHVNFTTNKGRYIGVGGNYTDKLENVRVLAIGGRATTTMVHKLEITYIDNYRASTYVERNVGFIVSYSPPFQKFEEYTDKRSRSLDSVERITENMLNVKLSASVEGEYVVKATVSTSLEYQYKDIRTLKSELEIELKNGEKKTTEITPGNVGVKLVYGDIMAGADGTFWIFPTTHSSYSIINATHTSNLLGFYDLTRALHTQMPGLKKYKTEQNSFLYYRNP